MLKKTSENQRTESVNRWRINMLRAYKIKIFTFLEEREAENMMKKKRRRCKELHCYRDRKRKEDRRETDKETFLRR